MRKSNFKLSTSDRNAIGFAIGLIVSLFFFGSCSPQRRVNYHIDRAEKIAKKHGLTLVDTITIHDTVTIPKYIHDTITEIRFNDSVTVINNERVRLVYHVDSLTREIHHEVECKETTVVKEIKIPTEKIIHKELLPWWIKPLVVVLFLLLLLPFVFKGFRR